MPISPSSLDTLRATVPRGEHRFLVTGVAGFIGSNLLEALLRLGQTVVGIDSFVTGRRSVLTDVQGCVTAAEWSRFRFIEGDIRDVAACHTACTGADVVLHQAAIGSVPRSIENPQATNASNIDGFLNVLVAARDARVRRFVYAASSSTYGDSEELPKVEERIGRPLSPYAVTKLVNELYADVFHRTYGVSVIGLRYFNVFGPRQDPAGAYAAVIPKWIDALLRGEPCVINGDGETTRDFCFIDNVIQANLRAAFTTNAAANNQVFNVAVGGRATLNDLHAAIRATLAALVPDGERIAAAKPQYGPFRQGDVRHSQASIAKAATLLGYEPSHDLRRGLGEAMPWYVREMAPAAT